MRILLVLTAILLQISVFSQTEDRLITENGKKYILHTVKPKETLYRISKTYGAGISEVIRLNPQITGNDIKIGEELKIPLKEAYVVNDGSLVDKSANPESSPSKPKSQPIKSTPKPSTEVVAEEPSTSNSSAPTSNSSSQPVKRAKELSETLPEGLNPNASQHIVQPGETLFRISKWYGKEVSDLVRINKLKDYNISEGQVIQLVEGSQVASTEPEEQEVNPVKKDTEANSKVKETIEKVVEPSTEVVERTQPARSKPDNSNSGRIAEETVRMTRYTTKYMQLASDPNYEQSELEQVISFINDNREPNKTGWFAIHKSLPVGTYVKIVNPINGATAYAKIIQNLPESPENKGIDIKLPLAAAQSDLKIFDDVTRVKVYPLVKKAK